MYTQSCSKLCEDDLILWLPDLYGHSVSLPVLWTWFDLVAARTVWTFSLAPSYVKMIWSCGCQNCMDIQSCSQLCEDDLILWLPGHPVLWRRFDLVAAELYGHSVSLPVLRRWFDLVARTAWTFSLAPSHVRWFDLVVARPSSPVKMIWSYTVVGLKTVLCMMISDLWLLPLRSFQSCTTSVL